MTMFLLVSCGGSDKRIAFHVIPGVGTYSAGTPDEVYALCPER